MIDFDLHGIVGIQLVDATPADFAKVRRQLGPIDKRVERTPDITIRFVDIATLEPLTYVGWGDCGFTRDAFYVLRGTAGVAAKANVPFHQVGGPLEVICERAMPMVPHLLAIINLTALSKGVLPLHASAFTVDSGGDSTGVLVTGWAKGGKTESLLGAMREGATYVGDEWIYLTADGEMLGLPEPIRLWSWHLHQVPSVLRARPHPDRTRLSVWHHLANFATGASRSRLPGSALMRRAAPIMARQAYLQISPRHLFGSEHMSLRGLLDAVVLVATHESPDIVVRPTARSEVSGRMAASLAYERSQFMAHYQQFRYAFPDSSSEVVERAGSIELELLRGMLDDRPTVKVLHPYPCDIEELGRTVVYAALQRMHGSRADARQ